MPMTDLSPLRARQKAEDRQKYLNSWGVPYDVRQAPISEGDMYAAILKSEIAKFFGGRNPMSGGGSYGHPEIDARVSFLHRDDAEKEQIARDNAKRQYLENRNTDPYNKRGIGPLSLQAGVHF